jgi:polyisoprenoid-binding protein YceI
LVAICALGAVLASSIGTADPQPAAPAPKRAIVAAPSWLSVAPEGRLWLEGDSSLHKYKLESKQFSVEFKVDPSPAGSAKDVEKVVCGGEVRSLVVSVPVDKLSSGDSGLDENARKTLKAPEHPNIVYRMESYKSLPATATGDACLLRISGHLTIAGVEKPVTVDAEVARATGGLRATGTTALLMSTFDVQPPKMFLGTIKTDDRVALKFDLPLRSNE